MTGILLWRGAVLWVLLRVALATVAFSLQMPPVERSLGWPLIVVLLGCGVLAATDIKRRHERDLLANLGISMPRAVGLMVGMGFAGEFALGLLLPAP